jgi:hypothetical protein
MCSIHNNPIDQPHKFSVQEKSPKTSSFMGRLKERIMNIFKSLSCMKAERKPDEAEPLNDPVCASFQHAEVKPFKVEDGRRIARTYVDPKTERQFGEEVVTRVDTVANHKELLNLTKDHLQRELVNAKGANRARIMQKLALCDKELHNLGAVRKEFISSMYVREELGKGSGTYQQASEGICFGMPVNFRRHECTVDEQQIGGHFRTGIMSYHANGYTNLAELQYFAEMLKDSPAEGKKAIDDKIHALQTRQKFLSKQRPAEAIEFAIAQLEKLKNGNAEEILTERRFYLESQFSHLLMGQIEKNMNQVLDPKAKAFRLAHVALLNPKKDKTDKTGWQHNEYNEMQDMHAIFTQFFGKKVIFDGKGPYIDAQGNFHDKHEVKDVQGKPKSMNIEPHFFNVSVQGYTVNDGAQKQLNEVTLDYLMGCVDEHQRGALLEVKEQLDKGKSSYEVAEMLAYALSKLGMPVSVGCLSAKDRTGFVSARLVLRHLLEGVRDANEKKRLQRHFTSEIFSEEGCASRVITDNTGAKQLKVSPANLPDVGFFTRAKIYSRVAHELLFPAKAIAD